MTSYTQQTGNLTYCGNCGQWYAFGTSHTCNTIYTSVVYTNIPLQPTPLEQKILEILDRLERIEQRLEELQSRNQ